MSDRLCSLWVAALCLLSGCHTTTLLPKHSTEVRDPRVHLIYVDDEGFLVDPTNEQRVAQAPAPSGMAPVPNACLAELSSRARREMDRQQKERHYVRQLIDGFFKVHRQRNGLQLTLYIHGGLNTFADSLERARTLPGYMIEDDHYPVFVGWPSGPFDTYFDHLAFADRGTKRSAFAQIFYGSALLAEDITRSVIRLPVALARQVNNALTVPLWRYSADESAAEARARALYNADFKVISRPPFTGMGQSYWSMVNPVWLITTPFVDGLGSGAWDTMQRRAGLVLTKASVYEGPLPPVLPHKSECPWSRLVDTGLTLFLREWQDDPRTSSVPINLIGHSMGAMVSLTVLVRHPGLNIQHLVFMGGAARIKDVENVLIPWMIDHPNARFYNLSLDPYNEIGERVYGDVLPRGSLLVWIDDTFGEVNSFRDRTVGRWWNVVRVAEDLFPVTATGGTTLIAGVSEGTVAQPATKRVPIRERVLLKRFAIENGTEQGPQTHAGFNDYCFWRQSFWRSSSPPLPFKKRVYSTASTKDWQSCADFREVDEKIPGLTVEDAQDPPQAAGR